MPACASAPPPDALELPRLLQRRPRSYPVSLVLVLLRCSWLNSTRPAAIPACSSAATTSPTRSAYSCPIPPTRRLLDRIDAHRAKVVELGILRRLRGPDGQYEVRRILKACVDVQWLDEFARRINAYAAHAAATEERA